jgi:hypothetical protein
MYYLRQKSKRIDPFNLILLLLVILQLSVLHSLCTPNEGREGRSVLYRNMAFTDDIDIANRKKLMHAACGDETSS